MKRDRVFYEVRAEADERPLTLKVRSETGCLLREVQTEARETCVALILQGRYWICHVLPLAA